VRGGYRACQLLCQAIWKAAFRFEAFGLANVPPEGQGVLLASNHQSFLDPVTVGVALSREITPVARSSLFRFPLFRHLISYLNALPIQPASADMTALRECVRRLEQGAALVLFPESTRTHDGSIKDMSAGFALIARKAGVPIVPVFTDGAFECWPRHRRLPRPGRIRIIYGRPISTEEHADVRPRRLAVVLKQRIEQLRDELKERVAGVSSARNHGLAGHAATL